MRAPHTLIRLVHLARGDRHIVVLTHNASACWRKTGAIIVSAVHSFRAEHVIIIVIVYQIHFHIGRIAIIFKLIGWHVLTFKFLIFRIAGNSLLNVVQKFARSFEFSLERSVFHALCGCASALFNLPATALVLPGDASALHFCISIPIFGWGAG